MVHRLTGLLLASVFLITMSGCAPEPETRQTSSIVSIEPTVPPKSSATPAFANAVQTASFTTDDTQAFSEWASEPTGLPRRYQVMAQLDWPLHTLHVEQQVTFLNTIDQPFDHIMFSVEPNQQPGQFSLQRVVDTAENQLDYVLEEARLIVQLQDKLAPGCATTLILTYDLTLFPIRDGYTWGRLGYFGYSERQLNLGMWMPLIAAHNPDEGWLTPLGSSVGEHFVLDLGDFDISLTLIGAPDALQVAGPGLITRDGTTTWHVVLNSAREVALSLSAEYYRLNTTTPSGIDVQLYYYTPPSNALDAPRHVLYSAVDALGLFEDLFGPYPYDRLTIVQGDFPDGMEFSGLVFVSNDWFQVWQNIPNDWLTLITVHEVAHQWWYALVANDQGRFPYLDEALAIYSELLFLERYYPEHVSWWWDFRVNNYAPQGTVDSATSSFDNVRPYINAIYLRGALMLQAVRNTTGDTAFFSWLSTYAKQLKGQIATPTDFWQCLGADNYAATQSIRTEYLTYNDPLGAPPPTEIP